MDPAHHDVPGSCRAETNDWGNMINATAYMIPPIIEKMDIAYGSRAQINAMTHMTPLAVVEDNSVVDKGFDRPPEYY